MKPYPEIQIEPFLFLLFFSKLTCLTHSIQPAEITTERITFNCINIKWALCFVLRFSLTEMHRVQPGRHSPVDESSFPWVECFWPCLFSSVLLTKVFFCTLWSLSITHLIAVSGVNALWYSKSLVQDDLVNDQHKVGRGHFFKNVVIKLAFTMIELEGGNRINLCVVLMKLYPLLSMEGRDAICEHTDCPSDTEHGLKRSRLHPNLIYLGIRP